MTVTFLAHSSFLAEWIDRYCCEHPRHAGQIMRVYHDGQQFGL